MRWTIAAALFACLAAQTAGAPAETEDMALSKVKTLELVWARALTAGDLQALDDLSDPAITFVLPDGGLLTKAELLLYAKSTHPQHTIKAFTKIQVFGNTAVVNGTYESRESRNGRLTVREGQFTDAWFHKDSSWVCIAAQSTPVLGSVK